MSRCCYRAGLNPRRRRRAVKTSWTSIRGVRAGRRVHLDGCLELLPRDEGVVALRWADGPRARGFGGAARVVGLAY